MDNMDEKRSSLPPSFQGSYLDATPLERQDQPSQKWFHPASYPRWWRHSSSPPESIPPSMSIHTQSRRPFFRLQDSRERLLLALLALSTFWFLWWPSALTQSDPIDSILTDMPLVDTHIDFPFFLRIVNGNHVNNLTADQTLPGQVDFPRLRKGKLGAAFWSVFVPCPPEDSDLYPQDGKAKDPFPDELYTEAVSMTYDQLDVVDRLITHFPEELSWTTTSSAIFHNHQFPPQYRTIGSVAGGEGLHSIGNKASNLRLFYALGMRYMTLTHNCHNAYADSALSPRPPVHGGLSAKGRDIVLEMNRMGMMVDISHVSADTMRDVLEVSEAPVIFTHSGARGVNDHVRNVPDDVLMKLKENKGVVQVPFYPEFISKDPSEADTAAVADHIEYIGKLIGYEHVGIGSDFDGMLIRLKGLEDVSKYPVLLEELLKRGLSYQQLAGVVGKNALRVMQDVEAVAFRSTRKPLEDDVPVFFNGSSTEA